MLIGFDEEMYKNVVMFFKEYYSNYCSVFGEGFSFMIDFKILLIDILKSDMINWLKFEGVMLESSFYMVEGSDYLIEIILILDENFIFLDVDCLVNGSSNLELV